MTDLTRADLGWSPFFMSQLEIEELETHTPARIEQVHRDRVNALSEIGPLELTLDPGITTAAVAVGDWVLCLPEQYRLTRVLERQTELSRGTEHHTGEKQLIAANRGGLAIPRYGEPRKPLSRKAATNSLSRQNGLLTHWFIQGRDRDEFSVDELEELPIGNVDTLSGLRQFSIVCLVASRKAGTQHNRNHARSR